MTRLGRRERERASVAAIAPIATITSDEAILARGVRVKLGIELDPGVYVIAATYDTEAGTWRSVAPMNLLVRDSEIRFDTLDLPTTEWRNR